TLHIQEGVNLGLVGESGSGKTTLGRLLLKLYSADSGQIFLRGQDVARLSSSQFRPFRKNIQMVFQDPYSSLDPRYTIRNILKEALALDKKLSSLEEQKRMEQVLKDVGLGVDALSRFPHEFSGGERQRIAIARALIMHPQLLILDEAVSSLDVLVQQQIIELLKRLQDQYSLTYIFISHNLRVVRKLCQQIAVMYQGKIVEFALTEDVFNRPAHPYTQELLSAAVSYRSKGEDSMNRGPHE
ncbi:MAG: ATP-binding cassette domain-containing protein, partial [Candidatus Omnitrophica bacterium]|nr:ATP-binding cassette domain-containing protein [Candidatus Omnitrophota bacterium]